MRDTCKVKSVEYASVYGDSPFSSYTSSTNKNCEHNYSFRVTVKFWIFSKIIEVCPECHELLK